MSIDLSTKSLGMRASGNPAAALSDDHPPQRFGPQVLWKEAQLQSPLLPQAGLIQFRLGSGHGFERVVRSAEGMLGNVRGGRGLARGPRSKTGGGILSGFPSRRMSCKGGATDLGHSEYAGSNPFSADPDGITGAAVSRIRFRKVKQHAVGAPRSISCQGSLVIAPVSLHG